MQQPSNPKLLVFAPCERVVIAAEGDHSSSLIAILQGFAADAKQMPEAAGEATPAFPMTWHIFALFENDYSGVVYRYRLEMRSPRKKVLIQQESTMNFGDKRFHRVNLRIVGFPLDGDGDYEIRLFTGPDGGQLIERGMFPVPIAFQPEP